MHFLKFYRVALLFLAGLLLIYGVTSWIRARRAQCNIAIEAYIYAYPLVLMGTTRDIMVRKGAVLNTFTHIRQFPTDTFTDIVRPNVDTLYSFAWLDLSAGPVELSIPEMHERYYLVECLDAWTNVFASLGKRTTGTHAQRYTVGGPQWNGLPHEGTEPLRAPTNMVLLLARILTNGSNDLDAVHRLQDGFVLKTLMNSETPGINTHDMVNGTPQKAPVDQVADMDVSTFYATFAQLLKHNPPAAADAPMLQTLRAVGVHPEGTLTSGSIPPALMRRAAREVLAKIARATTMIPTVNGWTMPSIIGTYGTDYRARAAIAYIGIGANIPEDAIYPTAFVDSDDRPLDGAYRYRIHFAQDQMPPVHAFWSITLYNARSFLAPNTLHRYALNDRNALQHNADGSLDIYIQHTSPGTAYERNWLPAPLEPFSLTLRLYWPDASVLDGRWKPPAVERV